MAKTDRAKTVRVSYDKTTHVTAEIIVPDDADPRLMKRQDLIDQCENSFVSIGSWNVQTDVLITGISILENDGDWKVIA